MNYLQAYLQDKEKEEQDRRILNQQIAMQQYDIEQESTEFCLQQSLSCTALLDYIELYGYNPFDKQYMNLSAVEQVEITNQLKFEKIVSSCLQVDAMLRQYFEQTVRCGTIQEEEEQSEGEDEINSSFGEATRIESVAAQKQLKLFPKSIRYGAINKKDQDFTSYKLGYQLSAKKSSQQSQESIKLKQIDLDEEQLEVKEYPQELSEEIDEQYDIPQFGSYDSQTFKTHLSQQLDHYNGELRRSLGQKNPQIHQINRESFKFPQANPFSTIDAMATKEEHDSPIKHKVKAGQQPQPQQQMSLLGGLFTSNVLKDMQLINDDLLPQEETNVPIQHQEITVERAFIDQQVHSIEQQISNTPQYNPSPFRILILDEIESELVNQTIEEPQFNSVCQQNNNLQEQLLQAKQPEIFEFIILLSKELQSKGQLTKTTTLKLQDIYKDLKALSTKPQFIKSKPMDNNSVIQRMYTKMSDFLTTQFIQTYIMEQYENSQPIRVIMAPLMSALLMVDNTIPLVNQKMPPITFQLLKKLLSNQANFSIKVKTLPKLLLTGQIQKKQYCCYWEHYKHMEQFVNDPDSANKLKQNEIYLLVRLVYAMQKCFEQLDNLVFISDPRITLNDNSKYEEQWKQNGTRYQAKKQKEDVQQVQNKLMFEKYGVDFKSWEINLQIQEAELKKIKKMENEVQWKERRMEKQQRILQEQKENKERLDENLHNHYMDMAAKEHQKQKETLEFREKQQSKRQITKQQKSEKQLKEQEVVKGQRKLIQQQSMDKLELDQILKQDKSKQNQNRLQKIESARKARQEQVKQQQQQEEEERVWQKAQELISKQKALLRMKEQILKQLQIQ